jgi:choline dehydrogenase
MQFDFVIVGAGSAGSVIANRLSESGQYSVLLLEAGVSDKRFYIQMPIGYGKVYYDDRVNYKYNTEPVDSLGGRRSYWPRGKVLGGSSSINAMVYVRGHANDYVQWSEVTTGWDWGTVAATFKSMENYSGAENAHRGTDGPLHVYDTQNDVHPLCLQYLQGAEQMQLGVNNDYNAESMLGASLYQITTHKGLRASASRCYLWPALKRKNLTVLTQADVQSIDIKQRSAQGVRFVHKGVHQVAKANKEVIVCAGAINSPKLLQLSGIGPGSLLQKHDIEVTQDNKHVGENLQDHLGADMTCRSTVPTLNQQLRPWYGKLFAGLKFLLARRGPLTLSLNQAGGFVKTHPDLAFPDIQLYFSPVSYTRAPVGTRPLINPDPFPGFLLGYNPCKPTSLGSVHIASANPNDAPIMHPNYLATDEDKHTMLEGMKLIRRLASTPALSAMIESEVYPGESVVSDDELNAFIAENAWTVFHQCGTCRMGENPQESVVDSRLSVHGVANLRVADASIFPTIPTGNTNAPAMMVGERASEFILAETINT